MKTTFQSNSRLELADQYVRFTNKNVFLTGKAGTGKTTFLKNIKATTPKRIVIVAPTGVAAINAGGVTIHSFFQLSFGPNIPENKPAMPWVSYSLNWEGIFDNKKSPPPLAVTKYSGRLVAWCASK